MARALVALNLSTKIKNVITFAQNIATALTNNPSFPNPTPALAALEADIAALVTSEAAVLSRTKGAVDNRDVKLEIVKNDLVNLRNYVESIAAVATPTNASSLIESAGMTMRKVTLHDKPSLAIKQGSVSGTVTLHAKAAAKRAAYGWQYSTDQKTWTTLPQTMQAKTGVIGLTPATTYFFRVQPLIRTGTENWSQPVAFVVQ